MAKHIVFNYEFDASAGTVTLDGIYAQKRLLIITNVNSNELIYSFTDPSKGLSDISFDYSTSKTTLTLAYDTSSMADTDPLQIFIEADVQTFQPTEVYTDPVSKFRVSNPENLIDTDFEYGLQSTKWETLELTKNIPTFFARNGDFELEVSDITTTSGDNKITVTTSQAHGLQRGSPLIVIGSGNILADGGFVVASVLDSTTFTYTCKGVQTITGSIKESFTQVFPGSIYSSTEFKLENTGSITTDSASPESTLTISTIDPTDFEPNTSLTISNTYAKAKVSIDTDEVETADFSTISGSYTASTPTGETDNFTLGGVNPAYTTPIKAFYFSYDEFEVDTATDIITFTKPHGFVNLEPVVFLASSQTSLIGPVGFRGYFVEYINSTQIRLKTYRTSSGSSFYRVNVSKSATRYDTMNHCFASAAYYTGTDSRNDYSFGGYYNTNLVNGVKLADFVNTNTRVNMHYWSQDTTVSNFSFTTAFSSQNSTSYDYFTLYFNGFGSRWTSQSGGGYFQLGRDSSPFFAVPIEVANNPKGGSFYIENHGLETGDLFTLNVDAGTQPSGVNANYEYVAVKIDDNRFSLRFPSGSTELLASPGSFNYEYSISATKQNTIANTILLQDSELQIGDVITYDADGNTPIGGLVDGNNYYLARRVGDRFNLSTSPNSKGSGVIIPSQASTTYLNTNFNRFQNVTHGFSTGDAVEYVATSPTPGLQSGAIYYVRVLSTTIFQLHRTRADANANTNVIDLVANIGGTATFTKYDLVEFTSAPVGEEHFFEAGFVGAADGVYAVTGTAANQKSFTVSNNTVILPREYTKVSQNIFCPSLDGFYDPNHGFITGDEVTVTLSGTTGVSGVTSGSTYYIISKSKDFYQLALSLENAEDGTFVSLSDAATSASPRLGTIDVGVASIVGSFAGQGTVSFDANSTHIEGEETLFTSFFNAGDTFLINVPVTTNTTAITSFSGTSMIATSHALTDGDAVYFTVADGGSLPAGFSEGRVYFVNTSGTTDPSNRFTVHYTKTDADAGSNAISVTSIGSQASINSISDTGDTIERTIAYVNSDGLITTTEPLPSVAQTGVSYFLRTQALLRSDGFALHRPYDGGVELIPSTNPDSQMIRQTRKYFRYQSGKGIQVSFAVNFSPTSQIDTFSASGTTGTISSRYPHRLSTGVFVNVSGSTNTSTDPIGTKTYNVSLQQDSAGEDYFAIEDLGIRETMSLYEGRTYRFDMSDATLSGHDLYFSTTEDGVHNGGTEYTTGVTDNYGTNAPGSAGSYIEITVATDAPTLYVYCSQTSHTGEGFQVNTLVDPQNGVANLWNGKHEVTNIVSPTVFQVALDGAPSDTVATGLVEYNVDAWARSSLKCGLFDDQNGIFFEYDGSQLYVCRRSSIQQLSGYIQATFRSGTITGLNTKFSSQVVPGDYIVLKGQTHLITRIDNDNLMYIAPSYRGVANDKIIGTIIKTTKIPQSQWNLDKCDGTGPSGFKLDIHKIQMAYVDYSWYGAGKVRFGFKDQNGDVKYVHQLVHGNFFTEAYMRSGNIPARYEIQNTGAPSYVPALAHWGTSVIMDGRFDNDRAYLFNAASDNLTILGSGTTSLSVSGRIETTSIYEQISGQFSPDLGYGILLDSPNSQYGSIISGTSVTGANLAASTVTTKAISTFARPNNQPYIPESETRVFNQNSTKDIRSLILLDKAPTGTSGSSSTYTIGVSGGSSDPTRDFPLISVRLAPSVDTSTPGLLGEREIINRMQLILSQVSVLSTHTAEIKLVLNGQLSNNDWVRVTNPSLSQLIVHNTSDTILNGASIFNFRAAGDTGTARVQQQTVQELGDVATLGNSILGGDNVYPDGPDILTVVATLTEDPSTVSSTTPFLVSGRISWSESQA